jgi:hypothetical protein
VKKLKLCWHILRGHSVMYRVQALGKVYPRGQDPIWTWESSWPSEPPRHRPPGEPITAKDYDRILTEIFGQ